MFKINIYNSNPERLSGLTRRRILNPYYRNTHAYRFRTHSCCISHLASQSPLGSRLSVLLARPWSPYHSCIYTHLALLLCFTRFSSLALQRQHAELTRNSASLLHTRVLPSRLSVLLAKPWLPSYACTLVSLKHMQFMKQALVSLDQCLDTGVSSSPLCVLLARPRRLLLCYESRQN